MTDESPSKRWTDMTRYESKSLRPSGSERCLSPSSGKSSHSQKVPVLDPWPLPTWNQHKHEYNTGGIDILSHGLMNINLWVLPLRNYSNGRKKSQLKTYSATFLRDVQANLLGVNKKLPHVLVVIPCSQGARPCWQTWRWRKAQQKWRYNQFNQPKWGYNGTYNHTTSTFIYTWSENRYPPSDHLNGKKYDKPMDGLSGFPIFRQTQMKYKLEKEIGPGLQTWQSAFPDHACAVLLPFFCGTWIWAISDAIYLASSLSKLFWVMQWTLSPFRSCSSKATRTTLQLPWPVFLAGDGGNCPNLMSKHHGTSADWWPSHNLFKEVS